MPEKPINGTRGWSILAASIVASLAGSGSGVFIYMQNLGADQIQQIARPDPATGTELRNLAQDLDYHIHNHPDIVNNFDRRITRIEVMLERIEANQQRLLQRERISP